MTQSGSASSQTWQDFSEGLFEGILLTDAHGKVLYANGRAAALLAIPRDELAALNVVDLVSGLDAAILQNIAESLETQRHVLLEAHCLRRETGGFSAEITVHRQDPDVRGSPLLFSVRDVTARHEAQDMLKQAQEEILESAQAKGRADTIAKLAHEVNNPLQVLLGMVEEDRNAKYAVPLNRMVAVLQEMRLAESIRTAGCATSSTQSISLPSPGVDPCRTRTVLIVDDEPGLRYFFRQILSMKLPDVTIEAAENGRAGVELFCMKHHAIILMDISMPVMNGEDAYMEIAKYCRKHHWEMPAVVFCTGYTPPESIRRAIAVEPLHCYLPKPVTSDTLVNAVKNRLEYFDLARAASPSKRAAK